MKYLHIILILLLSVSLPSFAQESDDDSSDDVDLSEYSYLWEQDDKKKKKKKKKKKQAQESTINVVEDNNTMIVTDTTKNTTSVIADSTVVADTVKTEIPIATDSISQDIEELPSDTTLVENILSPEELAALKQEEQTQDSLRNAEKAEKRAGRQEEYEDSEPVEDFRAGLPSSKASSSINGGVTYTFIDGKAYAGLVLSPEFSIGKVGIGIDVPILYGLDDKAIRTEIFKDGVGILRLIRYVRYGRQKMDPVYIKAGVLTNTMIGYGGLINNYSNSTSYEKRKIGLHYDINIKGIAGLEGMYSDFDPSSLNLLALRPYVRPFSRTPIPIVRTLEIGATFVKDKDQTALFGASSEQEKTYEFTKNGVGAFNFDAGITLLRVPFIQIDLFTTYSKLNVTSTALKDSIDAAVTANTLELTEGGFKNGTGFSTGFNFRFHFIADVLSTDVRIERLTYSDYYLPQFFDTSYEINKDGKIFALTNVRKTKGIYGSLTGNILGVVKLGGSLLIPDEIGENAPAIVTLNADIEKLADKFSLLVRYYKGGLTDLSDAYTLGSRSQASARFVYHLNKFIVAGVDYSWSFANTEDGFKTIEYISPYFGVSIQL